jgi:hypothetical protein
MKNFRMTARRICAMTASVAMLGLSAAKTFGIEGLTISIQNSVNVVLGWPSAPGATYIIQSIPSLNSTNGWQTLTNFYPAAPRHQLDHLCDFQRVQLVVRRQWHKRFRW